MMVDTTLPDLSTITSGQVADTTKLIVRRAGQTSDEAIAMLQFTTYLSGELGISGFMDFATYDPANISEQLVGLTASQTLTNKTLTSAVLDTGVSGTAVLDEDNMASDSATQVATQQSIKAYVDNSVTALTGPAERAAYYNASGDLASNDFHTVTDEGEAIGLAYAPTVGGGDNKTLDITTYLDLSTGSQTESATNLFSNQIIDSGADENAWTGLAFALSVSQTHDAAGDIGGAFGINMTQDFGDGVGGEATGQVKQLVMSTSIQDGYTTGELFHQNISATIGAGATITNGLKGININHTVDATASVSGLTGVWLDGTYSNTMSFYNGLQVTPAIDGNFGSFQGLQIAPNGSGDVDFAYGIAVDMSGVTMSGSGDARATTINATGGRVNIADEAETASGLFVDAMHTYGGQLNVEAGSPITGTDYLGNNFFMNVAADDDYDVGPLGIGLAMSVFGGQIGVASGKVIEEAAVGALGMSIAPTSAGGTVEKLSGFLTINPGNFGGSITIDNFYGFRMKDIGGADATNLYGIYIEDTGASNWMAKDLAIGATDTVTNSDCALELTDKRALKFTPASTAEIAGLTASEGMMMYDTTLNYAVVYNGSAWVPAGGASGAGDLLASNNLSDVASASTSRTNLGLAIGTDVQAWSAVLDATTASFLTADETKLDGIEALADVTDEANVVAALDGATLTAATVAGADKVLVQDADDSDNLKTVTAQSIADLASGSGDLLAANNLSDVASASTSRTNLGLAIGSDVQAHSAVLDATTASFTTADETKLDGIEALADVTDATNVAAAGGLIDTNNLSDVANAGTARTNLGLAIGSDVQAYSAVLAATTASFLTADETKLDSLESTSTDNALVRFDGVSGGTQDSGVILTDDDELSGFKANLNKQSGTTYEIVASDTGKVVECSNAAAITVTLPNDLEAGTTVTVVQTGAGQVTFSAEAGGSLNNRQSHTKIAGQYGMATLYVSSNSGTNAAWVLGGDTAS